MDSRKAQGLHSSREQEQKKGTCRGVEGWVSVEQKELENVSVMLLGLCQDEKQAEVRSVCFCVGRARISISIIERTEGFFFFFCGQNGW